MPTFLKPESGSSVSAEDKVIAVSIETAVAFKNVMAACKSDISSEAYRKAVLLASSGMRVPAYVASSLGTQAPFESMQEWYESMGEILSKEVPEMPRTWNIIREAYRSLRKTGAGSSKTFRRFVATVDAAIAGCSLYGMRYITSLGSSRSISINSLSEYANALSDEWVDHLYIGTPADANGRTILDSYRYPALVCPEWDPECDSYSSEEGGFPEFELADPNDDESFYKWLYNGMSLISIYDLRGEL